MDKNEGEMAEKSLMSMRNSNGPKIDPGGAPQVTLALSDTDPLALTLSSVT